MRSRAVRAGPAVLVALAFGVLSVLVHTHVTDPLDLAAFHRLYPGQRWGPPQMAGDVLVNALQPTVTGVVFVLLAWRRSRRAPAGSRWPIVLRAAGRVAVVTVLVAFLKWFFDRPDVHGSTAHLGGSYPSGHMVALAAYGAPWWLAVLLALALLVTGTHWLTDVVAGVLVGWLVRRVMDRSKASAPGQGRLVHEGDGARA